MHLIKGSEIVLMQHLLLLWPISRQVALFVYGSQAAKKYKHQQRHSWSCGCKTESISKQAMLHIWFGMDRACFTENNKGEWQKSVLSFHLQGRRQKAMRAHVKKDSEGEKAPFWLLQTHIHLSCLAHPPLLLATQSYTSPTQRIPAFSQM